MPAEPVLGAAAVHAVLSGWRQELNRAEAPGSVGR
jgi:hypothetical protein